MAVVMQRLQYNSASLFGCALSFLTPDVDAGGLFGVFAHPLALLNGMLAATALAYAPVAAARSTPE